MNDLKIEKAAEVNIDDLNRLFIEGDNYHHKLHPDIFTNSKSGRPREQILENINSNDSEYFIVKYKNIVIGLLHIKVASAPEIPILVPNEYALIENVIITEKFRNKGIGRLLLQQGLQWVEEKGLQEIRLSVFAQNSEAIGFYEKMGFSPSSIRYRLKMAEA